jgi:hypothetical protein
MVVLYLKAFWLAMGMRRSAKIGAEMHLKDLALL